MSASAAPSGDPAPARPSRSPQRHWWWILLAALLLPLAELPLPPDWRLAPLLPPILIYAILGLGLNIVAGFAGILHLGSAAFMAIGAYAFAILTCPIYPFQIGFLPGMLAALLVGAGAGWLLSLPVMRLRGDYIAITTLGFGAIIEDVLKNLDAVTKGTQSLNPVAVPPLPSIDAAGGGRIAWYLLLVLLVALTALLCQRLRSARIGRGWAALREDELAARAMGLDTRGLRRAAFVAGSALCAIGGALYASYSGTSIEPGFYDFQQSVVILCVVIVGGMGSVAGVLLGALLVVGCNGIVLVKLTALLTPAEGSASVLAHPGNWKFLLYGLALILMMRLRPEGLLPMREQQAELHHGGTVAVRRETEADP